MIKGMCNAYLLLDQDPAIVSSDSPSLLPGLCSPLPQVYSLSLRDSLLGWGREEAWVKHGYCSTYYGYLTSFYKTEQIKTTIFLWVSFAVKEL